MANAHTPSPITVLFVRWILCPFAMTLGGVRIQCRFDRLFKASIFLVFSTSVEVDLSQQVGSLVLSWLDLWRPIQWSTKHKTSSNTRSCERHCHPLYKIHKRFSTAGLRGLHLTDHFSKPGLLLQTAAPKGWNWGCEATFGSDVWKLDMVPEMSCSIIFNHRFAANLRHWPGSILDRLLTPGQAYSSDSKAWSTDPFAIERRCWAQNLPSAGLSHRKLSQAAKRKCCFPALVQSSRMARQVDKTHYLFTSESSHYAWKTASQRT